MLQIIIPGDEKWDEGKEQFVYTKDYVLSLEHSLISLSKWESKWHKPFLSNKGMSYEESIDYIRCMTLTQNVPPDVYARITDQNMDEVSNYIEESMTATWFGDNANHKKNTEIITSEVIYYWMFSLNIPLECQKWHLNRLLTLIRVCNEKNAPRKKKSREEIISEQAALNKARREKLKSKG